MKKQTSVVELGPETLAGVMKAVEMVGRGEVNKVHVTPSIKVYTCTGIIRIDINTKEVVE